MELGFFYKNEILVCERVVGNTYSQSRYGYLFRRNDLVFVMEETVDEVDKKKMAQTV